MDEPVLTLLGTVIAWLELAAAVLFIYGIVIATLNWARQGLIKRDPEARKNYRRAIGRVVLIGLDVLVAATILKTITLQPTLKSMGLLAAMAVIRTAIGWTTSLEMNGRWPWQKP